MPARKKKKVDRKKQILRIAANLFANRGYHETGFDQVAQQLDVTRPSLYYHVDSKGAVLKEICYTTMDGMLDLVKTISESNATPIDKLRNLVRQQIAFVANNRYLCTVLFDQAGLLKKKSRKKLRDQMKTGEQLVQNIIIQGVEQGLFAFDDEKVASYLVLSACHWIYKWYHADGRLTPEEIADKYIKILENGYIR
jgi:AcrR family transcriptional regulator